MDFMVEIVDFVCKKLRDLENSKDSQEGLLKRYKELLDDILDPSYDFLVDCLKAFIKAILNENVRLEISKELLSSISEKLSPLAEEVTKSILHFILDQMRPRFASFKQQDSSMRQQLAKIYERNKNWEEVANVLDGAPSETNEKQITDDSEFEKHLKLTHQYLLINDVIKAKEFLKQASQLGANTKNKTLKFRYKLYEAEILDRQGNFIEAAAKYHQLSRETSINKMEILTNALICTILASTGEKKKQLLKIFFEDEQYQKLLGYSILTSMHQGKLIESSELKDLEVLLQPYQESMIDDLGFSILNRVVMEHNLLLAGKSYGDITFEELEIILEMPLNKVDKFVAQMIEEKKLKGHIDRENATFFFAETEMETTDAEKTAPSTTRKRRYFFEGDSNKKLPKIASSPIWNNFHLDADDENFAICEVCNRRVRRSRWAKGKGFTVGNLIHHFERKHKRLDYKTYKNKNADAKKESKTFSRPNTESTLQTKLDQRNESTESLTQSKKTDDLTPNDNEIAQLTSTSINNITLEATELNGTKRDNTKEPDGAQKTAEEESNEESKSQECQHDKDDHQNCSESESRKMDENPKEKELRDEEKLKFSIEKAEKRKTPQDDLWQQAENQPNDLADGNQHESSISEEHTIPIQTPEFDDESDVETVGNQVQQFDTQRVIWKAIVHLENMAEFQMIVRSISGKSCDLLNKLPDSINVVGFVNHEKTMKYLTEIQKSNWMESIVVKLSAANVKDIDPLIALCSYLKQYECLGVANVAAERVQQIYLMPWLDQVPPVLQSIIGGSIDENFSAILLGIIIRIKDPGTLQGPAASVVQEKSCLGEGLSNGLEQIRHSYCDSSFAGSSSNYGTYYNANMSQRKIDLISGILVANRPDKLTLLENERETKAREENSVKIIVAGMDSQNALKNLSLIVPQVLGRQIKFEKVGLQRFHSKERVILKVEKEEEKWMLFRRVNEFKSLGIYFFSYQTEREREVTRWLKLKAKEIEEIGIRARTAYMGIFIDRRKWVWDDVKGMMIKTYAQDNKFH